MYSPDLKKTYKKKIKRQNVDVSVLIEHYKDIGQHFQFSLKWSENSLMMNTEVIKNISLMRQDKLVQCTDRRCHYCIDCCCPLLSYIACNCLVTLNRYSFTIIKFRKCLILHFDECINFHVIMQKCIIMYTIEISNLCDIYFLRITNNSRLSNSASV